MCESSAFLKKKNKKEKIFDEVTLAFVEGNSVVLRTLMGEEKRVKGKIIEVDADRHEIIIGES